MRLFPDLLGCRAAFVEPPRPAGELPPVRITLPDDTSVSSDSSDVDGVLSAFFRRDVRLARVAPQDFTMCTSAPRSGIVTHRVLAWGASSKGGKRT